jgi:hypothetical protein
MGYFTDGVVEDIVSALSRIRWLFVIARNSSFTYKGRAVDVKQVGRELGVRYVLEGSLRRAGTRVRITGQLVDAATGGHLWAQRYESALDNIFELQDPITESLDAYDYFLRGMARFHAGSAGEYRPCLVVFPEGDHARPQIRVGLWHGRMVPVLAQDQRLDH